MSRTAFKRDIDDWKTVCDFTDRVQSPERLRMLLILTNVDIRAVGPNIWNAWKCGLLDELYYRALEEMEMAAGQPAERRTMRVERAKAKLRARLVDWDDETREAYISARLLRLLARLQHRRARPPLRTDADRRDATASRCMSRCGRIRRATSPRSPSTRPTIRACSPRSPARCRCPAPRSSAPRWSRWPTAWRSTSFTSRT